MLGQCATAALTTAVAGIQCGHYTTVPHNPVLIMGTLWITTWHLRDIVGSVMLGKGGVGSLMPLNLTRCNFNSGSGLGLELLVLKGAIVCQRIFEQVNAQSSHEKGSSPGLGIEKHLYKQWKTVQCGRVT